MGLRGRKPKSSPPAVQAQGLDGLQLRLRELAVQCRAVVAQIIPLENAGVIVPEGTDAPGRKRAAAVDLLNGAAAPFLAKQPELNSGETLKALRAEVETIDAAIVIGARLAEHLVIKEAGERIEAGKPSLTAAMRQVALSVICLEKCLQARDDVVTKIRPGLVVISTDGWPLMGRVSNTASQAYRFLETAAREKWITNAEFVEAFKEARSRVDKGQSYV